MLSIALFGVASLAACVGVIGVLAGHPQAASAAIWGVVLLAALLLERWRYRGQGAALTQEWEKTGEQFVDPESGQQVQVYYCPRSGERRYMALDERPAPSD